MTGRPGDVGAGGRPSLQFNRASVLDAAQVHRWREFAERVPWAHYFQDPAWAHAEESVTGPGSRQPHFFWAEADGEIQLTAIGVRRRLPIPGRAFWAFKKGPLVLETDVLDRWLDWLTDDLGREVARLHVEPAAPLDEGGDDLETALERAGFVRRRTASMWATLLVDLTRDEEDILGSFRPSTRRQIRKSRSLGVVVDAEDTPAGWSTLAAIDAEMAARAEVTPIPRDTVARISRCWLAGGTGGTVLIARLGRVPIAAALVITHRGTAHVPVYPSSRRHGNFPASHLLIWEAIRWAREHGCTSFDLTGYSLTARPGEALWGINQFKRGFAPGAQPRRCVAVHEKTCSPTITAAAATVRRLQAWSRSRAKADTP
jgi:GNAT superfamily N-acetyltransferase